MKTTKIIHLLTVTFLIMLSACVGKIQEAQVPVNSQFQPEPVLFDYRGIETALPIAHDKVELSFARALGDVNSLVYKLYINDSSDPITLGLENLTTHFGGRYYYIVKGLNINTLYSFKIRAFNISDGSESKNENTKQARTYNNAVADFNGVGNLSLVPGQEDKAIKVSWDRVPYIFGLIPSQRDPIKYEVIYSSVSPDELFNPSSTHKTVIPVATDLPGSHPSSVIIKNLLQNRVYYFAVRVIHRGYQEFLTQGAAYIPIDRERNTKFLSLRTSTTLDWTNNIAENSQVQNAKGENGYTKITVTWDRASGSYAGYKILYRKFTEYDGPQSLSSFQFTTSIINTISSQGTNDANMGIVTCLNQTNPSPCENNQKTISNLTPGSWYHIKIFICELTDTSCPLIKQDGVTLSKSYDQKYIQVKPSLSSFMGLISIQNPTSETTDDEVTLEFSPPDRTNGWSDTMRFFCLDRLNTNSETNQYLIGTSPLPDAGTCTGVYRAGFSDNNIGSMKNISIRGTTLGQEYIFTASPEYNQYSGSPYNLTPAIYPPLERIKRTISPEIISPTISQFPGIISCSVNAVDKTISGSWPVPTGGIFQDYVFFWKRKTSTSSPFNFTTAMTEYKTRVDAGNSPNFTSCSGEQYCHLKVAKGIQTAQTPTDSPLSHGSYEFGVLTLFKKNSYYKWSQPNTAVSKCNIKVPRATFKEWTRIFAIGPKESHLNASNQKYSEEALLFTGIPWEVGASNGVVDSFFQPPGERMEATRIGTTQNYTINLSEAFDGKASGKIGSRNGIISIAWSDFDLDNDFDQASKSPWKSELNSVPRSLRKYGYKVYRSKDNRISWEDLTTNNLIHAQPYSNYQYRNRPNVAFSPNPDPKMAFFTDYSVINLESANGVEQARVYWYKIVPIFNNTPMEVTNPKSAMIKVTLPPPNMALVHRWMANRAQCLELGLDPDENNNYTCEFTGLGAVPKSVPFTSFETKIDIKGDLLVDRFELGCNFTRGDADNQTAPDFESKTDFSASTFSRPGCYKVATVSNTVTNDIFTNQIDNPLPGQIEIAPNPNQPLNPANVNPNSYLLYGDCIGNSSFEYPIGICTTEQGITSNGRGNSVSYSSPGYRNTSPFTDTNNPGDCTVNSIVQRTLDFSWIKNNVAQSTFGSVYHNSSTAPNYSNPVIYKGTTNYQVDTNRRISASCSINLAAINSNEYLPRWVNLNTLDGKINPSISLSKTPNELVSEGITNKLFDQEGLVAPPLPTSIANKKLGLILTTNKAGTPPLMYVERSTGKKLCQLYQVRQAYKPLDNTNTAVSPIGQIKNKRLLRKREFVASSLWPEVYTDTHIDYLEGIKGTLNDGERNGLLTDASTSDKSCVNSPYNNYSSPLRRWSKIPERMSPGHPHLSGSTINNQCTSRFGIQDLIGNQKENSSDVLFCDYSPIRLLWGKCYGGSKSTNGKCPEIRPEDPHIVLNSPAFQDPITGSFPREYSMLSKAQPKNALTHPSSFKITNNSSILNTGVDPGDTETDTLGEWGYHIELGQNAGYCSLVDDDATRRDDEDLSSIWEQDYFIDFFFKTINGSLVPKANALANEDVGSPFTFRDGTGHFLDFGDNHMTTSLANDDSIILPWRYEGTLSSGRSREARTTPNSYPLFSTLLGIPLSCGGTDNIQWTNNSCNDHSVQVMDSRTYELAQAKVVAANPDATVNFPQSTTTFPIQVSQNEVLTQTSITNYYLGGSLFKNTGLTGVSSYLQINNSVQKTLIGNFLSTFTYNADGTKSIEYQSQGNYDELEVINIQWSIERDQKLSIAQGGHFNKTTDSGADVTYNGRFSTDIAAETSPRVESGVRCGVMINEEE